MREIATQTKLHVVWSNESKFYEENLKLAELAEKLRKLRELRFVSAKCNSTPDSTINLVPRFVVGEGPLILKEEI